MGLAEKYNLSIRKLPTWASNGKSIELVSELDLSLGSGHDYPFLVDICITSNNRVHMVYRRGSDHNITPNGPIIYRYTDDLVNLSDEVVIEPIDEVVTANPCIFVTQTGRIVVMFVHYHWYLRYSDDGGSTWSDKILWAEYPHENTGWQLSGIGQGIQHKNFILKPMYGRETETGNRQGYCYRSTDGANGVEYEKISNIMPVGYLGRDWEEPTFLRRSDGLILCMNRSSAGELGQSHLCWSPDGGETWSLPNEISFLSNSKNGWCVTPSGTIVAIGRDGSSSDMRTILSYSTDGGKTWASDFADDNTGRHMYGGCVWHPGVNQIIVCYSVETGANNTGPCKIVLQRYNET